MNSIEEIACNIISLAGAAKSLSIEAVEEAKNRNFEEAKRKIEEANEYLHEAHPVQFSLISKEANGEKNEISVLLIHAQDHLMDCMTINILAEQNIELWKAINDLRK